MITETTSAAITIAITDSLALLYIKNQKQLFQHMPQNVQINNGHAD